MHAGGREDREKEMEREINKEVCSLIHPQRRVFSSVWRENVLKVALLCMVPGQTWHMVKTHVIDGRLCAMAAEAFPIQISSREC